MDKSFWLERWEHNETGFHQSEVNEYLHRHWPAIAPAAGRIFVPLCGKSLDMVWLRHQGHSVVGVELSDKAAQAFFLENQKNPVHVQLPGFQSFSAEGIEILCGDFFELRKSHLENVTAAYDRAALVAMPPEMRDAYARHMATLMADGTRLLLVTFDYDSTKMTGPPFAVSPDEVQRLFSPAGQVHHLESRNAMSDNPRFRERGASRIEEHAFLIIFG